MTPQVVALDVDTWENDLGQGGHGYHLDLLTIDCGWKPLAELRPNREFGRQLYETPSLIGCAFGVDARLYRKLGGFDQHMLFWGVEDLDLGLKCWLMGNEVLHDPLAVVGHRFRTSFDSYN
ncbi:MAG TPA: galactosyltransferase-related protein [Pseudonocardiaceae bacterium]|nr:galactosyltransferase-related protein [Pseudonocardiaceae bacterium]